jgi:hypothetical protein
MTLSVPKYREMMVEERLLRKKEVDDLLHEYQDMKHKGFALQHLLSSLDPTDDPPAPPRISIKPESQPPESEEYDELMDDFAVRSLSPARHATAAGSEEMAAAGHGIGQEDESQMTVDLEFSIKVRYYSLNCSQNIQSYHLAVR